MGTFLKVFAAIFMMLSILVGGAISADNASIGVSIIFYSFAFGFLLAGIGSVIHRLEEVLEALKPEDKKEKADAPQD